MDILELLNSLSPKKEGKTDGTFLAVGLGNPESKYDGTRHNIGFDAADRLCKAYGGQFQKSRHGGLQADITVGDKKVVVLKPDTYMNRSGIATASAAKFYKLPPEKVLIFCDDISLAPGVLRVREKGSAGGHNGLKSLIECLGSDQFPRIRIGVGGKAHADMDLADHVLGKPSKEDRVLMEEALNRAVKAVPLILEGKAAQAQSQYCHSKAAQPAKPADGE